jgi:hypothetical protein
METTSTFTVSIIGKQTGKPYSGEFVAKMVLTRRDNFLADAERRRIVGPSPEGTFPAPKLHGEAYILGLLRAHLVEFPEWWRDSDGGLDLEDDNVADEIMQIVNQKVEEYKVKLADQAEKAVAGLRKNAKKAE